MKHTKEPWEAIGIQIYEACREGSKPNRMIAEVCRGDGYADPLPPEREQDANVRRMVDCVNSLAGINNPRAVAEVIVAASAVVQKTHVRPGKHEDCQTHPALMVALSSALAKLGGAS